MFHFVLVFFSPFSIAITSIGEERANLSAFRTFVRFVLVWICRFPLPLGVWEGLRFVIVALPGLFSYLFFGSTNTYERMSANERSIVNTHSTDNTAKFAVGIKENQDKCPTLYWLPKLHKRPYKARFIANFS